MKRLRIFFITTGFLLFSAGACFWLDLSLYGDEPDPALGHAVVASIRSGESFQGAVNALAAAGAVGQPLRFRIYARLKGYDRRIRAGEYRLLPGMSPRGILEMLTSGRVLLHRFTVPEGFTLRQIAAAVEAAGLGTRDGFLAAATAPPLARQLGIPGDTVEGYLFPETYYFPVGVAPADIVRTLVDRFRSVFTAAWQERADALKLSVHQIVTLASIIEKETGDAAERPIISSVFHNRMGLGMRLESDPTVIYGIEDFDGNLTRRHLAEATPYNTYRIRGLPPGPIANPGREALHAALYPAQTDYLFFVAKKDRTHAFSRNFVDHNQAVRTYQLNR